MSPILPARLFGLRMRKAVALLAIPLALWGGAPSVACACLSTGDGACSCCERMVAAGQSKATCPHCPCCLKSTGSGRETGSAIGVFERHAPETPSSPVEQSVRTGCHCASGWPVDSSPSALGTYPNVAWESVAPAACLVADLPLPIESGAGSRCMARRTALPAADYVVTHCRLLI